MKKAIFDLDLTTLSDDDLQILRRLTYYAEAYADDQYMSDDVPKGSAHSDLMFDVGMAAYNLGDQVRAEQRHRKMIERARGGKA